MLFLKTFCIFVITNLYKKEKKENSVELRGQPLPPSFLVPPNPSRHHPGLGPQQWLGHWVPASTQPCGTSFPVQLPLREITSLLHSKLPWSIQALYGPGPQPLTSSPASAHSSPASSHTGSVAVPCLCGITPTGIHRVHALTSFRSLSRWPLGRKAFPDHPACKQDRPESQQSLPPPPRAIFPATVGPSTHIIYLFLQCFLAGIYIPCRQGLRFIPYPGLNELE